MSWRGYGYDGAKLYHSGVRGQKWGERRYQNEDGTWTEEGKERRRKNSERTKEILSVAIPVAAGVTIAAGLFAVLASTGGLAYPAVSAAVSGISGLFSTATASVLVNTILKTSGNILVSDTMKTTSGFDTLNASQMATNYALEASRRHQQMIEDQINMQNHINTAMDHMRSTMAINSMQAHMSSMHSIGMF